MRRHATVSPEPLPVRRVLWLVALVALPQGLWGDSPVKLYCDSPEQIENGFIQPHRKPIEKGTSLQYYCNDGYTLIGPHVRQCMADEVSSWWDVAAPQCRKEARQEILNQTDRMPEKVTIVVRCENPVVEHGTLLSGFKNSYAFDDTVTFECAVGYFMIGSYLIQCNEGSSWNPEVPSCRKIAPDLCGAPLIPTGSVEPLKRQYKTETEVIVRCNPQQHFSDETIEMTTVCQGYNLWEPPVQPCFVRTSQDTYKLEILHGRLTKKKRFYYPGDNVTVQCKAGYSLQGSSNIRYIGGNKWVPGIPSCSLSFFFILLILAILFIVLLLPVKMLSNVLIKVFLKELINTDIPTEKKPD